MKNLTIKGGSISMTKEKDYSNEFDKMYNSYQKEVEKWSGGLVQTNKAEFLKQYSFYVSVVNPVINDYVNAFYGRYK